MEVKTDKKAIWVIQDNVEKLIWEDDYTEDMEVVDLTITNIDKTLVDSIRENITNEKYDSLIADITSGEIGEQITEEVKEEKYDEYYEQVTEDPWIPEDQREAKIQELLDAETTRRIDAYARGIIEEYVQKEINTIRQDNLNKNVLIEKATPLEVNPEIITTEKDDEMFISSLSYLPDFLQEKEVFKDASKILDVLLNKNVLDNTLETLETEYQEAYKKLYDQNKKDALTTAYNEKVAKITKPYNEYLKPIYEAYRDTLYKWPGYSKLSYGAKITFLQEKGFTYMLDLLQHRYDKEYNDLCKSYERGEATEIPVYADFVKEKTDKLLSKITMLFELLYVLKGETLGLELAMSLVDINSYIYMPWDIYIIEDENPEETGRRQSYRGTWDSADTLPLPGGDIEVLPGDYYSISGNATNYYIFNGVAWHPVSDISFYKTPREQFTAVLEIYGLEDAEADENASTPQVNADLQKRLVNFVRSYMLPYIDVTLRFDADIAPVYCYASGSIRLLNALKFEDYEKDGERIQHNLINTVSDEHWMYAGSYAVEQINFGTAGENGFQGSITLAKSYVEDPDGTKHYLYGTTPIPATVVSGTALHKIQDTAIIDNYENDYLETVLERYVDIDITTGNQINAYFDNDEFIRDTVIKFYSLLTVGGIHLVKTVEQMHCYEPIGSVSKLEDLPATANQGDVYSVGVGGHKYMYSNNEWMELTYPDLLIEDFEHEYTEAEVWLGRKTDLECVSGWNHDADQDTLLQEVIDKVTPTLFAEYSSLRQPTIDRYITLYKESINENTSYYSKNKIKTQMEEIEQEYPDIVKLTQLPVFYEFDTTDYPIRELTGVEDTHLTFCEEALDTNYTGIGDIGILGANDYFIYNGMLLYHSDKLRQIGESKNWTDIGASHAVSEMYYTPGICDGALKVVHLGELYNIERDPNHLTSYTTHLIVHERLDVETVDEEENKDLEQEIIRTFTEDWAEIDEAYWNEQENTKWENITGYINEYYTAFGICNGRLYKLYQNPLYGGEDQPFLCYQIMDNEQGWTYITGMHYSETYEAYGIKNKKLYRISNEGFNELKLDSDKKITGKNNVTFSRDTETSVDTITYITFAGQDNIKLTRAYDSTTDKYVITRILFNDIEQTFTKEDTTYTTGNLTIVYDDELSTIYAKTPLYIANMSFTDSEPKIFILTENTEIEGWNGDCISRYHHSNGDYTTYGICNGILYAITADSIKILDNTREYSAICGFYNENSPRTFAYTISNGALYEIQGNSTEKDENTGLFTSSDVVLKDNTMYWKEIHGSTTATNNFVVGLACANSSDTTGYIYKINAKSNTPEKLDNRAEWTSVYGRHTTSTSKSANCYGYAVRLINGQKKLYEITKDGISIVSGFWKVNGTNEIVDLEDYNIHEIKTNLPDGTVLNSIQEIKENAVYTDTVLTDYDIYVTYTTTGFNNNQRYNIRTELTDTNYYYIHPSEYTRNCYEDYCYDLFDTDTGLMTGFIERNIIVYGSDIIMGSGTAFRFKETETYFELPSVYDLQETVISFECTIDDDLNPIILDLNNKSGIFYGKYNNQYGIFLKYDNNGSDAYTRIVELNNEDIASYTARFVGNETCDVYLVGIGRVFASSTANNKYVYIPRYLGGNGTIYGDATIYLQNSYLIGENRLNLFENGKYFSIETLSTDLIETLTTDSSQDTQKVIEITKEDNEVLELSMDELYSMLEVETDGENLSVSTDYNVNRLQHDPYEGVTKATLEYVGAYEMDPEKIVPNVPLNGATYNVCDFKNTGIAENLNGSMKIQFRLSTDFTDPIIIKSGSIVENQKLFITEENEAYTNKYLLESEISAEGDVELHTVPSGIVYEVETEEPQTVSRTLVYNNTSFEIDENKIDDYSNYYFDSYNATIQFYPQSEWDTESAEYVYVDAYSTIYLSDEETESDIKVLPTNENEMFMKFDTVEFNTGSQDTYYKFNIERSFVGYNETYLTELNPETDPKDRLQYYRGKCWNFNETSYFVLNNFAQGMVLCIETDDDTSKDQGIFQFGNGSFCIKDNVWTVTNNETVTKSTITAWDKTRTYIKFKDNTIYTSKNGVDWETLFENITFTGSMQIGYAEAGSGYLPFNGTIDLARSYVLNNGNRRLYKMTQITDISTSTDGETFTELQTITTDYTVDEITIGHEFTGRLDCYYSKLLKSYDLQWVENRQDLNTIVRNILINRDPSYNPDLDENIYDITEYGIHITGAPKRWDNIVVTYTTVDKAYYMEPNTDYLVKMDVIDDKESGKLDVDIIDNPTLVNGIMSDFANGYCATLLTGQYIVLKLNITDITDQAICGYSDTVSQAIFIEDGKIKYFDDINKYELIDAEIGPLYLKLYSTANNIEYSFNGEVWKNTNVEAQFTAYDTFNLGVAYVDGSADYFHGEIDLTESYIQSSTINYLFTYYKKIIPQIYDGEWHNLALEPLLTLNDTVTFAKWFDGKIDMYNSGLCLENTRHWQANKLSIYLDDVLMDEVIRDSVNIDPIYAVENELVEVDPNSLYCYITGVPRIGDKVILTYNSWYLFREKNTTYEFKVTNTDSQTIISYNKIDGTEYILYITDLQNLIVNTGYQFNGTLSIKDSTRDGRMLCDYQIWYTYLIKYKKDTETEWTKWTEFLKERKTAIYERMGYDLDGTHYLDSSWIQTDLITTPFVTYYNYEYINPVGQISFSTDGLGTVTGFSNENYLEMVMDKFQDQSKVRFWIKTGDDISDQDVSTFIVMKDGYFHSTEDDTVLNKLRPNYTYIMDYNYGFGEITVKDVDEMTVENLEKVLIRQFAFGDKGIRIGILGYNIDGCYEPTADATHTVTLIPYNPNVKEGNFGYYIENSTQANKLSISYRKVEFDDNEEDATWYDATLSKETIDYYGTTLTIYVAKVEFPNTEFEYYRGDKVQFRIVSGSKTTYMTTIPYNNIFLKQRTVF